MNYETCSQCGGLEPKKSACGRCGGKGLVVIPTQISDLPKRECQRDYIDEFFAARRMGSEYRIAGRKVVEAWYGHCADYPKGFVVVFE